MQRWIQDAYSSLRTLARTPESRGGSAINQSIAVLGGLLAIFVLVPTAVITQGYMVRLTFIATTIGASLGWIARARARK
jgi:hypothetical protein